MQIIFFWLGNQSFLFRSFHWSQNISTLFFIFLINVFLLLFEQVAPPHFVHGRVWLPNPKCVYRSSRISLSFFCLTNSWFSCSRSPSCSTSLTEAKEDEDDDDVAIALFSQNCTRAYSLHVWMSNLAISLHLHTHTHIAAHTWTLTKKCQETKRRRGLWRCNLMGKRRREGRKEDFSAEWSTRKPHFL